MNTPNRVLAFGAHPDDLEIGAGGLLARLSKEGAHVVAAVISIPSQIKERMEEARAGARILGVELVVLNPAKEARVEDVPMYELVRQMDQLVKELKPDLVITHSVHDLHWDHGLSNRATVASLRRWPCNLLAYRTRSDMNAHLGSSSMGLCFADITTSLDTKLKAIPVHASQMLNIDLESVRNLALTVGRVAGVPYAEAYEVLRLRF
jgi:LmbE family N-acetylglucosaminyl deacetylase